MLFVFSVVFYYEDKFKIIGEKMGFKVIDDVIDGLVVVNMIVIVVCFSMGKMLLVINIVEYFVLLLKKIVLFISLEMIKIVIGNWLLLLIVKVNFNSIKYVNYLIVEESWLCDVYVCICEFKLCIDDNLFLMINDIRVKLWCIKRKYGFDLIVIDYL